MQNMRGRCKSRLFCVNKVVATWVRECKVRRAVGCNSAEDTILEKATEDAGRLWRLACRMAEAATSVVWCDNMVESDGALLIGRGCGVVYELPPDRAKAEGRCHGWWFGRVRVLTPLFLSFPPIDSRFSPQFSQFLIWNLKLVEYILHRNLWVLFPPISLLYSFPAVPARQRKPKRRQRPSKSKSR